MAKLIEASIIHIQGLTPQSKVQETNNRQGEDNSLYSSGVGFFQIGNLANR